MRSAPKKNFAFFFVASCPSIILLAPVARARLHAHECTAELAPRSDSGFLSCNLYRTMYCFFCVAHAIYNYLLPRLQLLTCISEIIRSMRVRVYCCTIKFSTNRRNRAPSRYIRSDTSRIERHIRFEMCACGRHLSNYILGANQCVSLLHPVLGITRQKKERPSRALFCSMSYGVRILHGYPRVNLNI